MRKSLLSIFLLAGFATAAVAQNNTSSPYSRFGYGELNDNVAGAFRGMGSVGLAMRDHHVINPANPASFTSIDSLTFMFDLGASGMWTNYSDAAGVRNRANGNLEYLTLQLPIWHPYIAFSAGVLPYSMVGYDFKLSNTVNEICHDTTTYMGSGGFTQVYGGLSFNLFNWVALGANVYYMFGDVTNARSVTFAEAAYKSVSEYSYIHAKSVRFRYGMHLFHTFGQHTVVLGGIFENKKPFRSDYIVVEVTTLDTIPVNHDFDLPMTWGGGFSYNYANRLTVSADVLFTEWKDTRYAGQTDVFRSRMKIAAGVEYRHNPNGRKYHENMYFRLGATVSDSYIKNITAKDFGISLGVGFPLRNAATIINTTLEYNHRGTSALVNENSLRLTINASISETWFFKRRL